MRYKHVSMFLWLGISLGCFCGNISQKTDFSLVSDGKMLYRFMQNEIKQQSDLRRTRFDRIASRDEAEAYVAEVRRKLAGIFGPLPAPVNPAAKFGAEYRVGEIRCCNVVFHSRNGLLITAALLYPRTQSGRDPAVIVHPGHSSVGKGDGFNAAYELALNGYIGLVIDPIGQGERYEHFDTALDGMVHPKDNSDHLMLGNRLTLVGESLSSWVLHDNLSAIDFLKTVPGVDVDRIGFTGASMGGMATTFLNPFAGDEIKMIAVACYAATWKSSFDNELLADHEQFPRGAIAAGLECADLLLASPPRKILLLANRRDYFDFAGTLETYQDVKKIYRLLGCPDDFVKITFQDEEHGYYSSDRKSLVDTFNGWLGRSEPWTEGKYSLNWNALNATPNGRVVDQPGAPSVGRWLKKRAMELAASRGMPDQQQTRAAFAAALKYREMEAPSAHPLRPHFGGGAPWLNRYAVEVEPGISNILVEFAKKPQYMLSPGEEVILYVPHANCTEMKNWEKMQLPWSDTTRFFGVNVRGSGESFPRISNCGDIAFHFYGPELFFGLYGLMMDRPLQGDRVRDVVAAAKVLKQSGVRKIHLSGSGCGGVTAALAALLYSEFETVTLYKVPASYHEMAISPILGWPTTMMLPGILQHADLPDVYRALKSQHLTIKNHWNCLLEDVQ